MQDIRNFFSLKPAKEDITAGSKLSGNNEKKGSRKRAIIDSDSEEDPPIRTPNKKPTRNSAKSKIAFSKKSEVNKQSKYFEVDTTRVKSLFGTEPVKQVMAPKQPAKLALNESELADVSAAFLDIDDDDWAHTVEGPSKLMASGTGLPTSQKVDFYRNTHRTSSPEKLLGPNQTNKRSFDPEIEHGSPPEPEDISPAKKLSSENRQMLETPAALTTLKEKKFNGPVSSVSNLSSPVVNSRKLRNSDPFLRDSVSPSTQGSSGCLSSAQSSSSGYSTSTESRRELFELWVDKYKPTSLKQIIGQQSDKSNVVKLIKWLSAWDENQSGFKKIARPSPWAKDDTGAYFKAALLSGPPGVGKTTTAHLVCRELGLDLVEFNASDTRSKKLLHQEISELLTSKSLNSFAKGGLATSKRVLIMDEVDGMAGNEDRGGMQELIDLIKNTKIPVICMCNDRNHPKIRSLVNYCFDLRFFKPKADQIKGAMLSICFKERIKIKPDVLANIIASTNQDVRLVLNHLSVLAARKDSEMAVSCKEVKLGAWDVLRQVFSETDHKTMTIHDKMDLFFHDYSIAPLFVQENYLNVIPHAQESQNKKGKMKLFAEAALALSHGDMIDRAIRSQNAWSLLPTQAFFSSYIPGQVLEGHVGGMINFPAWLGKNSKKNKMDRMAQEVQSHTRLKASASVESIKMDYARGLRDALLNPLVRSGSDGVEESLSIMKEYSLLREDLDSICELSVWPAFKDPMTQIDSKVKAAFTRAYNKNPVMTPFSISGASIKKGRAAAKDDDFLKELLENEGDDSIVNEENEDDSNPLTDGMITAKKSRSETTKEAKTTRNAANTSKKTSKGREGVASTKKRKGTKL